jgi:hypothetical protein
VQTEVHIYSALLVASRAWKVHFVPLSFQSATLLPTYHIKSSFFCLLIRPLFAGEKKVLKFYFDIFTRLFL